MTETEQGQIGKLVRQGCGCGMLNVHPSAPGVELGPGTARPPEVVALREIDD